MAMKHFENIGAEIIKIESESILPQTLIDNQLARPSFVVEISSF